MLRLRFSGMTGMAALVILISRSLEATASPTGGVGTLSQAAEQESGFTAASRGTAA